MWKIFPPKMFIFVTISSKTRFPSDLGTRPGSYWQDFMVLESRSLYLLWLLQILSEKGLPSNNKKYKILITCNAWNGSWSITSGTTWCDLNWPSNSSIFCFQKNLNCFFKTKLNQILYLINWKRNDAKHQLIFALLKILGFL